MDRHPPTSYPKSTIHTFNIIDSANIDSLNMSPIHSPKSPIRSPNTSPIHSPNMFPIHSPKSPIRSPNTSPIHSPNTFPIHSPKSPIRSPKTSPIRSPNMSPSRSSHTEATTIKSGTNPLPTDCECYAAVMRKLEKMEEKMDAKFAAIMASMSQTTSPTDHSSSSRQRVEETAPHVAPSIFPPLLTIKENMIHIGQDVWVAKTAYEHAKALTNKGSIFVRTLAIAVFGYSVLRGSSVTGKKGPHAAKDEPSKPALNAQKLLAIQEIYRIWLMEKGTSPGSLDQEVKRVNFYIGSTIADLNAKGKDPNREKKKKNEKKK